jgi:hypothetical protein
MICFFHFAAHLPPFFAVNYKKQFVKISHIFVVYSVMPQFFCKLAKSRLNEAGKLEKESGIVVYLGKTGESLFF